MKEVEKLLLKHAIEASAIADTRKICKDLAAK